MTELLQAAVARATSFQGQNDSIILAEEVAGPAKPITRVIVFRQPETRVIGYWDVYVATPDGPGYSMLGRHTELEARQTAEQCTSTLRICQLWDTVPGLQWKNADAWQFALDAWIAQNR